MLAEYARTCHARSRLSVSVADRASSGPGASYSAFMRAELWGGPHDGAIVVIDGAPPVWQEPVPPTSAEVHEREKAGPDARMPIRVAEYRRQSPRKYTYIGQHWL